MEGTDRTECALCVLGDSPAGRLTADDAIAVVARDDDVVTLVQFGLPGVFLTPRHHIATLSVLPDQSAAMLAALQRTAAEVVSSSAASGAMIEATTDVPGAKGHVCYHVVPTLPEQGALGVIEDMAAHRRFDTADSDDLAPCSLQPTPGEVGPSAWPMIRLQGLSET